MNRQVSLILLVAILASAWTVASARSYSFSYASPNGDNARYEIGAGNAVDGGYRYISPEGGLVAVRYSSDPSGDLQRLPLTATERRFSAATGALADPYGDRDPSRRPSRRHSFSYVLPDGHSRYESWQDGEVIGGYRYTSPDGARVAVRYTAGKDGFRPVDVSSVVSTGPLAVGTAPAQAPAPAPAALLQTARAFPTLDLRAARPAPPAPVTYPVHPYYVWRHLQDDDDHDDFDDDDWRRVYYQGVPFPVASAAVPVRPQALPVYQYPTAVSNLYAGNAVPSYYPLAVNQYVANQYRLGQFALNPYAKR